MDIKSTMLGTSRRLHEIEISLPAFLGQLLGVIMPTLAAFIYPTYMHHMGNPFYEWTRLQELPFVFAEICVIVWAMARGMELRNYFVPLPRDIKLAMGAFGAGLWGSTLFVSEQMLTSITISASTCVHIVFGLSIYHLFTHDRDEAISALPFGLGLGLIVLTLLTAWRFLLPPPASEVYGGVIEWGSALPGFINVRHFGSWTGAIAALFAAFIIGRDEQREFDWHDGFFTLAMGLTIWTGTRAAILAIGCAGLIQLISMRRMPSRHVIGRLSILTAVGAAVAWLLLPSQAPEFMLFQSANEYSSVSTATSGRSELWIQTLQRWLEAPLFGWGSGSTFWKVYTGWTHTQPHNFILQFLISWGLVGAIGAFWLLGRTIARAHSIVARQQPMLWPLLSCLYALIIMACLEGMLHYPRFFMLIVALLAMILKFGSSEREAIA